MKIMVMLSNVSRALFIILVFACHCAGNLADDGSWTEMYDENGVTRTFKSVQDMIKSDDYTDHEEITAEQELYRNETVILNSDIDSYSTKLMSDIGAYTSIIDAFMKDTQELEDRRSIIDENTIEVKKSLLHERNAVERLGENISSLQAMRAKSKNRIEEIAGEINEIKKSLKSLDVGLKSGNYDENLKEEKNAIKDRLVKRITGLRSELKSQESEFSELGKTMETELRRLLKNVETRVNYQMEINKMLSQNAEAETLRLVKMTLPPLYAEIDKQKGVLEDTKDKLGQVSAAINNDEKLIDLKQENIKQLMEKLNSPAISKEERIELTKEKKALRNEIREARKSIKASKKKASEMGNMLKEAAALLNNYTEKKKEAELRIIRMKTISEMAANERNVLERFAVIRNGY